MDIIAHIRLGRLGGVTSTHVTSTSESLKYRLKYSLKWPPEKWASPSEEKAVGTTSTS